MYTKHTVTYIRMDFQQYSNLLQLIQPLPLPAIKAKQTENSRSVLKVESELLEMERSAPGKDTLDRKTVRALHIMLGTRHL